MILPPCSLLPCSTRPICHGALSVSEPVLLSGVPATMAGVLLAFPIPSRTAINQRDFLQHGRAMLDHYERAARTEPFDILNDIEQQIAVDALEDACEKVKPPLHRLEHALHPWVTFVIMPLFALANAGVSLFGA